MTAIESCYFAALIDALRIIHEREVETGVPVGEIDPGALYDYVRDKGERIAIANGIDGNSRTSEPRTESNHLSNLRAPRAALCSKSHGRHYWAGQNVCRSCGADFFEVWRAKQERAQRIFALSHGAHTKNETPAP